MGKEKKNSIFDYLNCINHKTEKLPYDKKEASPWMLMLWFSHPADCIHHVNRLNSVFGQTPDASVYDFLYSAIPKRRRFIKYTKGNKKKPVLKKEGEAFKEKAKLSSREISLYSSLL